jgi:hypothetical protein
MSAIWRVPVKVMATRILGLKFAAANNQWSKNKQIEASG